MTIRLSKPYGKSVSVMRRGIFDCDFKIVSMLSLLLGGNIASDSILESVEKMYNYNILSAVAASHVASQFLSQNGLLVLTGAHAAFEGTSGKDLFMESFTEWFQDL